MNIAGNVLGTVYFVWIIYSIVRAWIEVRELRYVGFRLKSMLGFTLFVGLYLTLSTIFLAVLGVRDRALIVVPSMSFHSLLMYF